MKKAVKVEPEPRTAAPARRGRPFKPRYPAWLVMPSLVYIIIFFLGAMAILVAFSLATQVGFGQISFGSASPTTRRSSTLCICPSSRARW